jgi:hypothetical protein
MLRYDSPLCSAKVRVRSCGESFLVVRLVDGVHRTWACGGRWVLGLAMSCLGGGGRAPDLTVAQPSGDNHLDRLGVGAIWQIQVLAKWLG